MPISDGVGIRVAYSAPSALSDFS